MYITDNAKFNIPKHEIILRKSKNFLSKIEPEILRLFPEGNFFKKEEKNEKKKPNLSYVLISQSLIFNYILY